MLIAILLVILGLGILVAGAEALVRGSASMAKKLGISSLVIGLTVVAFGTSMPELVVNLVSAFKGTADIAIGNVIGSNIANILLILGIAAMVYPLKVAGSTVWKEIPFTILVDNAVILATLAGLSQAFIGLTIVAVGTSLPELATSVVAAIHKHDDIAVGNIVGSNIFNVFWILGLTATLMPLPFNPAASFDVLVGVATSLLLFFFMFISTKHKIDRWQGAVFFSLYVGYIVYLVMRG